MARKPNILFIMADQFRLDALGRLGGWARTPNLDRVAAEGVAYTQCFTASPLCVPARVALATGRYPHNTGMWDNHDISLSPQAPTWMAAIRDAGYRTSLFGKTHLHAHKGDLREREPLMRQLGLDDIDEIGGPHASTRVLSHMTARWESKGLWADYKRDYAARAAAAAAGGRGPVASPSVLPLEEYADVYVGSQATQYLKDYRRDQPWFCWVSFGGPHEPWDAPEPYASMYDPAGMPLPRPAPAEPFERPRGNFDGLHRFPLTPAQVAGLRANYAGNVTLIDEQVGRLLAAIEARGELDNTVILFTSDHGEMNGDAGLLFKSNFLDSAIRVPLLLRTPATLGSPHAGRVDESSLIEWIDIGPTLAHFAGATLSHAHHARGFEATATAPKDGAGPVHREDVLAELKGEVMLASKAWKIALNGRGEAYQLFDRVADPLETRNLAGSPEHAGVRERLRLRVLERMMQSQTPRPAGVTEGVA
ncbi:MAG: sulfatase-like hydrolase/transferase [Planctomycetota bacterium]|nr:sulfatase-like hydrolase/transferase [Planctomycetota bacterium]